MPDWITYGKTVLLPKTDSLHRHSTNKVFEHLLQEIEKREQKDRVHTRA